MNTEFRGEEGLVSRSLAAGIASGDEELEEQLIKRYRTRVLAILEKLTGDSSRAEDLAHETLIIILNRLRHEGINEPHHLSSYIYRTAKYVYLGWLRRADNRVELRGCLDDFECGDSEPENQYIHKERKEYLYQSIVALKINRDRDILLRRYIAEQSKDEICDVHALSTQHFDRVIFRARNRLKQSIGAQAEPA